MSSEELASNPDEDSTELVIGKNDSENEEKKSESEPSKSNDADEEPDETLSERLWGLTEMFPEPVKQTASTVAVATKLGLCRAVSASRTGVWIIFSSSVVLFAPLLLEVERANVQELQKSQQKELLLGPSGAISGGVPPMLLPSIS